MKISFCVVAVIMIGYCRAAQVAAPSISGNDIDLLFHYIAQHNPKAVKKLIERTGLDVEYFDPNRKASPLAFAAKVGELETFKYLWRLRQKRVGPKSLYIYEIAQLYEREKIVRFLSKKDKK